MFEINPSDKAGVFIVAAKFLGVRMDSVDLVFQVSLLLQETTCLTQLQCYLSTLPDEEDRIKQKQFCNNQ